jgi:hypothetical protein
LRLAVQCRRRSIAPPQRARRTIVRAFAENELDRHPGIRTSQHGRVGPLRRRVAADETEVAANRHHAADRRARDDKSVEQRSERPIAVVQSPARSVAVAGTRTWRRVVGGIAIDDLDGIHRNALLDSRMLASAFLSLSSCRVV